MNSVAKNYLVAFLLTITAVLFGIFLQDYDCLHISAALYAAISLCMFTLGTVGRLGFKDFTWGGSSAHENLDYWLFLILYFIGLASGIASLKPESTTPAAVTCSSLVC